jgi:isoquinoline 1-oxidoreductase beta subunit
MLIPRLVSARGAASHIDTTMPRRMFLKVAGSGFALALAPVPTGRAQAADAAAAGKPLAITAPSTFVRIDKDNTVTVVIKHLDKGQGLATGQATLVAEELGADWTQVKTEFAPSDATKYNNLLWGPVQGTGGSTGLANAYEQYRMAGATMKAMLATAAAKRWGVKANEITVSKGVVAHANSGRRATMGQLAESAALQPLPEKISLKDPKDFTLIGKSAPRVDQRAKTMGRPLYTMDVQRPGQLVAVVARPPKFGAKLKSVDSAAARVVKGVVDVVQIPNAVAVLATSTYPAIKARDTLKLEWDTTGTETRGSAEIIADYKKLLETPGKSAAKTGDAAGAMGRAAKVIEHTFEFPYLAHTPMEPLDVVIQTDGKTAELWLGSQLQTVDHAVAAGVLGLKIEQVKINTLWAGGSFGRRAVAGSPFVAEAALIAKAYGKSLPIKVVHTREDDIKGGYYRPLYVHKVRMGLDAAGKIIAWEHRIAGQSIVEGTPFAASLIKDGIDATSVEGASNLPYDIPNMSLELHTTKVGVPVLWWRSVGSTHTAHVTEHMIDLAAREAKQDPVAYRMAMLSNKPRHAGVLKLATEKANWSAPLPAGTFRGVAVHESFNSFVAQVAEVSLDDRGRYKVQRVVCAVDCGVAVNPDNVKAQMEGGLGYGLSAALREAITLKGGAVEQSQWSDYELMRMSDMPKVEVHIVASTEKPTGVGEPGTPVVLPAVANALLAGSGKATLALPLSRNKYARA